MKCPFESDGEGCWNKKIKTAFCCKTYICIISKRKREKRGRIVLQVIKKIQALSPTPPPPQLKSNGCSVTREERYLEYSKTCVKRPLSKRQKIGFQDQLCLMQVKSIAILSTFIKLPFVIKFLFCLFLSGGFKRVLLYI